LTKDTFNFFEKQQDPLDFRAVKISIASPERIRSWSFGEVKKPETINYRTFKPERDGLFCAKIFGPVRDYECICGKYKRMKHRGIVCDKCGVEVIHAKVRRERLGHINLATPVAHIWFLKSLPSRIGAMLDVTLKDVEKILYSEAYIILPPDDRTGPGRKIGDPAIELELKEGEKADKKALKIGAVISEEELDEALKTYGNKFKYGVGGESILKLLSSIRVDELADEIRKELKETTSETKRKALQKRIRVVDAFNRKGEDGEFLAKPEWMMLSVLPVLPPDLRPLVPIDGGRFATSDLNDLYRRVINRNNRLLKLVEASAPEIIVRNEKRMLQEAVDALFDNGRRGKTFTGPNKRPLRSLSEFLKGKQGRFRQNLLGKRVDYSGRSVIVVGPELKLHQCGLPKRMAIELFKPFLFAKLEEHGVVSTIKSAKKLVEKERPEVWDILEEVTKEHPVLLNRAPTLHRLGIQAFEPVLIEGKAIRLHPLVCFAFNADFDGDQMAVHVPLSTEAQIEARVLMMSTNNLLSPASGSPVIVPSQDIVLGVYYLTKEDVTAKGAYRKFSNLEEVRAAFDHGEADLQAPIEVRLNGTNLKTTVGRAILSELIPEGIDFKFINKTMGKKELAALVDEVFRSCGPKQTALVADALRSAGYYYSTKGGLSISIGDMVIPAAKQKFLDKALDQVKKITEQYSEGLITEGERYNKVVDIWAKVTEAIAKEMFDNIAKMDVTDIKGDKHTVPSTNNIFMMADSGARGSAQQIRQLAGMRGLMSKPSGDIIETPITSNFREGLNVLEYFTSTHGARKGLADTALKTASSGYLTRRLVDVAQDAIILSEDCGTRKGIKMSAIREGSDIKIALKDRILGRVVCNDVKNSKTGEILVRFNEPLDEKLCEKIDKAGVEEVEVRSPLTCEDRRGLCAACYGRDLATGRRIDVGEAVGVIAAQSIGEPGTQLTMRTFHFGGTATHKVENSTVESRFSGKLRFKDIRSVENSEGRLVVLTRNGEIEILDGEGNVRDSYPMVYGSVLSVRDGQEVKAGDRLGEWDQFAVPIVAEVEGRVRYADLVEGKTLEETQDELTNTTRKVVIEAKNQNLKPRIELVDDNGQVLKVTATRNASFPLPAGCTINAESDSMIRAGEILAKIPRETTKTKDITGGLPRVAELFEARRPKNFSQMAKFEGTITFDDDSKGKRKINLTSKNGTVEAYTIPKGKHLLVQEGDFVRKGEQLFDGQPDPHDILKVLGEVALATFLVSGIQEVYRLQGVKINDKHIETIVRQMLRMVMISESGDSALLVGETISKREVFEINDELQAQGKEPAKFDAVLLGITKASLSTESFISAASFQETTKVLTDAAINSKVDNLRGLKENVIMGRLIPAGTGAAWYRGVRSEVVDDDEILDGEALAVNANN